MKLKIKVTKDILKESSMCGVGLQYGSEGFGQHMQSNCAITKACRDLFPGCYTTVLNIKNDLFGNLWSIDLPEIAQRFIYKFDLSTPEERIFMPELEFEVELTDEVLAAINIEEAREALKNSTTLELIEV